MWPHSEPSEFEKVVYPTESSSMRGDLCQSGCGSIEIIRLCRAQCEADRQACDGADSNKRVPSECLEFWYDSLYSSGWGSTP